MNDALLRLVLILIAAITVLSGLTQMVVPGFVLGMVAGTADPLGSQLFATVGMFMLITGALFLICLWRRSTETAVPFWIGVQKALAALFVARAVFAGIFLPISLGVASFDALSAVLCFIFYWRSPR